jgi:pimeloyl-ACP methyl ester carboxylesterase
MWTAANPCGLIKQMKKLLRYKNETFLSYADYGDREGFPLLVQHGLIASIEDETLFERLLELGVRLICTARPGYGESSPYEMNGFAEWAEITAVLVDALGLERWDVLGISSGAPYGYALGAKFRMQARNIFILSGMPALYDEQARSAWPYPLTQNAAIRDMQKLAHTLFFANLTPEELETPDIKDSMMNDCFGVAQDLKLRGMDWGFDLSDIQQPVTMQHSRLDPSVPLAAAERTAQLLAKCRLRIMDTQVHFSQELLNDFIDTFMAEAYRK